MYLLDTDICSYILREKPEGVSRKFGTVDADLLHVSVITCAELLYGVRCSHSTKINAALVMDFLSRVTILPWTIEAADQYATLRPALEKAGNVIGNMDMLIAAHALSCKATMITNNVRHFNRIPNLPIENWAQ
jgi:tRNA(fMet)-specific endonuclease VapC